MTATNDVAVDAKVCCYCGQERPITAFHVDYKTRRRGHKCRYCRYDKITEPVLPLPPKRPPHPNRRYTKKKTREELAMEQNAERQAELDAIPLHERCPHKRALFINDICHKPVLCTIVGWRDGLVLVVLDGGISISHQTRQWVHLVQPEYVFVGEGVADEVKRQREELRRVKAMGRKL